MPSSSYSVHPSPGGGGGLGLSDTASRSVSMSAETSGTAVSEEGTALPSPLVIAVGSTGETNVSATTASHLGTISSEDSDEQEMSRTRLGIDFTAEPRPLITSSKDMLNLSPWPSLPPLDNAST